MYNEFFQLSASPFTMTPDPKFLYLMPHTREALAVLRYGITARKGFIVLTGEVGTGKTTLLRTALASFDKSRVYSSFIFNPGLDVVGFLEFVLTDFGIPVEARTKSAMLIQLNRWLIERYRSGDSCVLIVDEAQNLSNELLEEIRLLTNLEAASEKLLQIVLSGQPELERKIRRPELRQLQQRISLWCRTQPLTIDQTGAYIAERLLIAGSAERIFDWAAVLAIHRLSRGIPRVINLICEHALILAYVDQVRTVSSDAIVLVAQDLGLEEQSFLDRSPGIATEIDESGDEPLPPEPGSLTAPQYSSVLREIRRLTNLDAASAEILQIVEHSLILAYADQVRTVSPDTISLGAQDLGLEAPSFLERFPAGTNGIDQSGDKPVLPEPVSLATGRRIR